LTKRKPGPFQTPDRPIHPLREQNSLPLAEATDMASESCGVRKGMVMVNSASTAANAEAIAIEALGFVAGDPALLPRFLSITGIEAQSIRAAAREPGFLAGVLEFLLAHEPTLLQFCEQFGIAPAAVASAQRALPLGGSDYQTSP
jgi:hypothetical protein